MDSNATIKKSKRPVFRIVALSFVGLITIAGIILYHNLNRLLSDSLIKSFNSTLVADVYELKFEKLWVNVFEGSIYMRNASMQPREEPLHHYPYINSSFRFQAENLTLRNVEIFTLLKSKKLILERISITRPTIDVILTAQRNIMVPFKDSTATNSGRSEKTQIFESFMLNEFQLIDASFHIRNTFKQREFWIDKFNVSLHDLLLRQQPGEYFSSFDHVTIALGKFNVELQKGPLQQVEFTDFKIGIDTLSLHATIDTILYQFRDFNTEMFNLDAQTADSLFHLSMKSFDLSYENKNVLVKEVGFKPNVSHEVLQSKFKFQHTEFSGTIGSLEIKQVDFDSLLYGRQLLIESIKIDQVKAYIFKDKTKAEDPNRKPDYLGQTISAIRMPLRIKQINGTNIELENTERKTDSTMATVSITKAKLDIENVTNLSTDQGLSIHANAHINDKAQFNAKALFSYKEPRFTFEVGVKKFDLPDLNELIQAYTPAKINKGIADEIHFTGTANSSIANGTMKFLYHDLEVDLELANQAKWKSSVIAFAANTALHSSNPASADSPSRIVQFQIDRDLKKGFVNVLIKSFLGGLKETMIMSKENRKKHNERKRKAKEDNR